MEAISRSRMRKAMYVYTIYKKMQDEFYMTLHPNLHPHTRKQKTVTKKCQTMLYTVSDL